MNVRDIKASMSSMQKFYVDYDGEVFSTTGLHEKLAREICEKRGWKWKESGHYSAEEFIMEKGFIKFSNYSQLRYVALSKKYYSDRKLTKNAFFLAEMFNLKVEFY